MMPRFKPIIGGVGSVAPNLERMQFDSALDRVLRDRELICNLLVGITLRDQSQYQDFRGRQPVVRRVLRDLV